MGRVGTGLGNMMNPFRNPFSNPFAQNHPAAPAAPAAPVNPAAPGALPQNPMQAKAGKGGPNVNQMAPPGGAPQNTMNFAKPIPQPGMLGGLAGALQGAQNAFGGANAFSNKTKGTNFNPRRGNVVGGQLKPTNADTAQPNKIHVDPRRELQTNQAAMNNAFRRFQGFGG